MLGLMIERPGLRESIDLNNTCVHRNHNGLRYRTIRGYTVVAALCDEIAFGGAEESANPAEEILCRLASSHEYHSRLHVAVLGYGRIIRPAHCTKAYQAPLRAEDSSRVLVIQADTRTMNPTVPQSVIDRAIELDPMRHRRNIWRCFGLMSGVSGCELGRTSRGSRTTRTGSGERRVLYRVH